MAIDMDRKSSSAIYCIKNTLNNKVYIGSAVNYSKRKSAHIVQLKNGTHHSKKLLNAWNKYGEEQFQFIVIESVEEKSDLLSREQFWIDHFNSCDKGYNTVRIAGSTLGFRHSIEAKEKIGKFQKGNKKPDGFSQKISELRKGKVASVETKIKLSKSHMGKTHSNETKAKMANAKIGSKMPAGALSKAWETRRKNKTGSICGSAAC